MTCALVVSQTDTVGVSPWRSLSMPKQHSSVLGSFNEGGRCCILPKERCESLHFGTYWQDNLTQYPIQFQFRILLHDLDKHVSRYAGVELEDERLINDFYSKMQPRALCLHTSNNHCWQGFWKPGDWTIASIWMEMWLMGFVIVEKLRPLSYQNMYRFSIQYVYS